MVWIALALLGFTATFVGLNTLRGRWGMHHRRWLMPQRLLVLKSQPEPIVRRQPPQFIQPWEVRTCEQFADGLAEFGPVTQAALGMALLPQYPPGPLPAPALFDATAAAFRAALDQTPFFVFSNGLVFALFTSFLLPVLSLSFATEALGGEREGGTLVWLLTKPLSRPAVYLAKFAGLLPWAVGLNLGGFAVLCLLAGPPGRLALRLYWPAVLLGTLAFCALFHLLSALFRRAAVVGLVYSFFLEAILGNMPGLMKRVSLGFYTRCLMFDLAEAYGVRPERASVYLPVSGPTAAAVLVAVTAVLLLAGMAWFSRSEYRDLT